MDLTAIVLTYNEQRHIARCIDNLRRVASTIFVVDSFSTDRTCDIAREHGAVVLQHAYVNQSQQFIWALDNCPVTTAWTLRLDADEYLSDALIAELEATLPTLPDHVTGCRFPLLVKFLGRELRHGKIHAIRILRLWRTGLARMEQRWMDERCYLTQGDVIDLKNFFIDENLNGLGEFTRKH
ncbi:MAG: glycosyltransferase family 2 protein, partial [Bacteroidaceae bacterium]|nr:glycosyltransferase family 2 protein [Bacteroidaceae bacterium]